MSSKAVIEKPVVLVDMDGVLADFETANNRIIATHFPDAPLVADRKEFYFTDTYKDNPELVERLYHETRKPGFFKDFAVVEGAIQGWQRIITAGFTPRICSSPLQDHHTVVEEKIDWLREHFVPVFGESVIDSAIFDRDKSGYNAVAMIDDRPTLRNIEKASWRHIVFTRSYNLQVETKFRLQDWSDPELENLLRQAQLHAAS